MNFQPKDPSVDAVAFIVPNRAAKLSDYIGEIRGSGSTPELFENVTPETKMVQVWVFGPEEKGCWSRIADNWGDHGLPEYLTPADPRVTDQDEVSSWMNKTSFPAAIPSNVLEGCVEGDIVNIAVNGTPIRVQLDQLNTRYGPLRFEDVFEKVIG